MHALLCPPTHFFSKIYYAINPQMEESQESGVTVDKVLAFHGWMRLAHLLQRVRIALRLDIALHYILPEADSPDMVFTANAGLPYGGRVALSHFAHPERQKEESHFLRYFLHNLGVPVSISGGRRYFEGQGDALFMGDTLVCGYGFRSEKEGHLGMFESVRFTGQRQFVRLVDPHFYHLDTCFCPMGKDILWYPPAFSPEAQTLINGLASTGHSIVISDEDATRFVANGIYFENAGRRVLITSPMSGKLRARLNDLGIVVWENDVSEFLKAGGGNKCLVFLFN